MSIAAAAPVSWLTLVRCVSTLREAMPAPHLEVAGASLSVTRSSSGWRSEVVLLQVLLQPTCAPSQENMMVSARISSFLFASFLLSHFP